MSKLLPVAFTLGYQFEAIHAGHTDVDQCDDGAPILEDPRIVVDDEDVSRDGLPWLGAI
ncbi:hypothetical protein [Paraburkholderia hiiakae]|uniref:hypothetical protein n=1 Tax=Paraburkholderia hiiakae TaxID=1081782 RepID=UPI001917F244|nr:hypothetical protein [Paraburkholderia hiiakae]